MLLRHIPNKCGKWCVALSSQTLPFASVNIDCNARLVWSLFGNYTVSCLTYWMELHWDCGHLSSALLLGL